MIWIQVKHSFNMSSVFKITHVNMRIYQSSSSGVLDALWPLHKPKSLTNAPLQSFLHENTKLLNAQSSLTCLQRLSVQWWSHRGTRRRPSLLRPQCWTPVILRSPPNAPGYQTPQTLWTIRQKRVRINTIRIMRSWRITVLKQSVDRKLYLLQHHLYPKPSNLLSALQRRKQRAGRGCTHHRIKHPI